MYQEPYTKAVTIRGTDQTARMWRLVCDVHGIYRFWCDVAGILKISRSLGYFPSFIHNVYLHFCIFFFATSFSSTLMADSTIPHYSTYSVYQMW